MAYDPATYKVNLDTPQPDGRKGESPRNAFTKYNALVDALKNAPPAPTSTTTNNVPQWSNTTGTLKDGMQIVSSPTDTSGSKLLTTGFMGIGSTSANPIIDPDSIIPRGMSYINSGSNRPYGKNGLLIGGNMGSGGGGIFFALVKNVAEAYIATRGSDQWSPWDRILTERDIVTGTNANGRYIWMSPGIQICINEYSSGFTTSSLQNGQPVTNTGPYVFARPFSSAPWVLVSALSTTDRVWPGGRQSVNSSQTYLTMFGNTTSAQGLATVLAIGSADAP